ncbi:hypothetical protein ACFW1A_23740 [Kitasatospora sp. NPDC058965]|uniref:hypothetical protein n=1 Tax=Kitasatospora sp. NPDC058965 TaxID=3346682 RepID=UPI0036BB7D68
MDMRLETQEQRRIREFRELAEYAVQRLEGALRISGLPFLPSLAAGRITITEYGAHINLGGCNPHTMLALADWVEAHARCTGRIARGAILPARLAELPVLHSKLRKHDAEEEEPTDPARLPDRR